MTPKWHAMVVRGELSPRVLELARDASGAYAIREKEGHRVVYVGESHTGALRRTMLRHFQVPESFKKKGRASFATSSPERYEVAIAVTSRGKRTKKHADERAMTQQAAWISSLRPAFNKEDGLAGEPLDYEPLPELPAFHGLINPRQTYAQARAAALAFLKGHGWDVAADLKVPRATSRDREIHLWFKPQAVWMARGRLATVANARSTWLDLREHTPTQFVREVYKQAGERLPAELAPAPLPAVGQRVRGMSGELGTVTAAKEGGGRQEIIIRWDDDPVPRETDEAGFARYELVASKPEGYGAADPKRPAQLRLLNPPLVELGKLTELRYRDGTGRERTLRWVLTRAPILAYVPGGKPASLRIVYGGRTIGRSSGAAAREYARTHWGENGAGAFLSGRMLEGDAPRLGVATVIVYTTKKGEAVATDYEHAFGGRPPALLSHRGMVRLSGGTYHVDTRGIVG